MRIEDVRFEYRKNFGILCFKLLRAIINNDDYSDIINELKKINFNVYRLGKVNKWKSLYNDLFLIGKDGLKYWDESIDDKTAELINNKIVNICKEVTCYRLKSF